MASSFSIYDPTGSVWRTATKVAMWDDSASTWRVAKKVYMWDGGFWRLGFTDASISGLNGRDIPHDPTLGYLRTRWTANGDTSGMTVDLYADIYGGTTYSTYMGDSLDPSSGSPYDFDFSGLAGFTSLDNVTVRARLLDGVNVVTTLTMSGPYGYE